MNIQMMFLGDDGNEAEVFTLEGLISDPKVLKEVDIRDDGTFPRDSLRYFVAGECILNLQSVGLKIKNALGLAEESFSKAIELGYTASDVYDGMGHVKFEKMDLKGAVEDYSIFFKSLDLDNMQEKEKMYVSGVYSKVGSCYLHLGEYEESLEHIERAVELAGDNVGFKTLFSLAEAYNWTKDYQKAVDVIDKCSVNEYSLDIYEKMMYFRVSANANYRLANYDVALDSANKLLVLLEDDKDFPVETKASFNYLRALIKHEIVEKTENIQGITAGEIANDLLVYITNEPDNKQAYELYKKISFNE